MKKYFYALVVAVFATMSLAVTGCSKDDDGEGYGKSAIGDYYFITDNVKYYYGLNYVVLGFDPETDLNSSFDVYGDDYPEPLKNTIDLRVHGYSWIYKPMEDYTNPPTSGTSVSYSIWIKKFDYKNTASGTKLEIANIFSDGTDTEQSIIMSGNIAMFFDITSSPTHESENVYHWHKGEPIGVVTFVSYKNGLLTLKFENITMWNDLDTSKRITMSGTITFRADNDIIL